MVTQVFSQGSLSEKRRLYWEHKELSQPPQFLRNAVSTQSDDITCCYLIGLLHLVKPAVCLGVVVELADFTS